jgi:hypothetical protein
MYLLVMWAANNALPHSSPQSVFRTHSDSSCETNILGGLGGERTLSLSTVGHFPFFHLTDSITIYDAAVTVYVICYRNEGASPLVSDVDRYVIVRNLLDSEECCLMGCGAV